MAATAAPKISRTESTYCTEYHHHIFYARPGVLSRACNVTLANVVCCAVCLLSTR
eukprot:COSAG01_NODE_4522_length_4956_cov_2.614165_3_plen_55_part_00